MGRPYPEVSNNVWHLYVSFMLLEIDLLTLSLDVGLKWPPFINPICGQMGRPCPDVSKKVWHLYVSILVFEMALLTLFMGVGLKKNPFINPKCGWIGCSMLFQEHLIFE